MLQPLHTRRASRNHRDKFCCLGLHCAAQLLVPNPFQLQGTTCRECSFITILAHHFAFRTLYVLLTIGSGHRVRVVHHVRLVVHRKRVPAVGQVRQPLRLVQMVAWEGL